MEGFAKLLILTVIGLKIVYTVDSTPVDDANKQQGNCISSPEQYINAFESNLDVPCVGSSLYVTLQGPCSCSLNPSECPPTASKHAKNTFAWVSGSENLEVYLGFNNQYPNDRWSAVRAMLDYVGFEDSYMDPSCKYRMAVMERDNLEGADIFAPSFVTWWEEISERFQVKLDPEVEKQVSLYGFTKFDEITGCTDRETEPVGTCGTEFEETRSIITPRRNKEGTPGCMSAFSDAYQGGFSANEANARAMLYVCFGANGLFTGVGYGYDGANFTDAEYIIENKLLKEELGAVIYQLYPVEEPSEAVI